MAAPGTLPRYFALFDESYHRSSVSDPRYCHNRIKILGAQSNGTRPDGLREYALFVPSIPFADQLADYAIRFTEDPSGLAVPMSTVHLIASSNEDYTTVFWKTGLNVHYSAIGSLVPVLDFSVHGGHPGQYIYRLQNDTYDQCSRRQRAQRQLRSRMMRSLGLESPPPPVEPLREHGSFVLLPLAPLPSRPRRPTPIPDILDLDLPPIPSAPAAAPAPPAAPTIPSFVAEALKRDAISREECCPIMMTPFEAQSDMTVLSCFHLFETSAVTRWLVSNTLCPVCKQAVTGRSRIAPAAPPAAPSAEKIEV